MAHGHNAMPVRMTVQKHKKHGRPKLRSMNIQPTENGGYVVEHNMDNNGDGPYMQSKTHAFGDAKQMHAHVKSVFPAGGRANVEEDGEQA